MRLPARPLYTQDLAQRTRRIGILGIPPQADVLDRAGLARLQQVGAARQQRDRRRLGGHHGALEEHEAAAVVAGQPVMAFLCEDQDCVEPILRQGRAQLRLSRQVFLTGEG